MTTPNPRTNAAAAVVQNKPDTTLASQSGNNPTQSGVSSPQVRGIQQTAGQPRQQSPQVRPPSTPQTAQVRPKQGTPMGRGQPAPGTPQVRAQVATGTPLVRGR